MEKTTIILLPQQNGIKYDLTDERYYLHKDLRIETIIGIFDWERKVKQEVSIDMEFPFDCKKAAATDSIKDTTDYIKPLRRRNKVCRGVIIPSSRNSC